MHKPRLLVQNKDNAFSNLMPAASAAEMRRAGPGGGGSGSPNGSAVGTGAPTAPAITGNYEDDATKELDLSSFDRGEYVSHKLAQP